MRESKLRAWNIGTWNIGALALLLVLLAGCTVGPNYRPPALQVPPQWSEPLNGGETNSPEVATNWWNTFDDPELNSLIQRAARANLQVRAAQARLLQARAQWSITAGGLWPSVDAVGSYTRNRLTEHYFLPLPPSTPLNYSLYNAGFDASWELDVFGGTRRAIEAADANAAASEFNRRAVLVSLKAETARNYFEVRGYQQQLVIARRNILAQTNTLQLTRERNRAGLTSELDVHQAAALLATTEAPVPTLETGLQAAVHRLGVLLGEPPGALMAELSRTAPIPPPPPKVPVGLPSDLLRRRPDVQSAERQLAASTALIGVAKSDLFPKFSLTGNAGFQSVDATDWFTLGSRMWSIGPTMTWRIFDAGRIRGNIRLQKARQQEALATYEQTVLSAFEDVENALTAYAKEQVRYRSLAASVTEQRAALQLSQDLYKNGLADFLRVLDSERALYEAEDALVQSRKNVAEDLVALYKALGGGWSQGDSANQTKAHSSAGE